MRVGRWRLHAVSPALFFPQAPFPRRPFQSGNPLGENPSFLSTSLRSALRHRFAGGKQHGSRSFDSRRPTPFGLRVAATARRLPNPPNPPGPTTTQTSPEASSGLLFCVAAVLSLGGLGSVYDRLVPHTAYNLDGVRPLRGRT